MAGLRGLRLQLAILRRNGLTVWALGATLFFALIFGFFIVHFQSFSGPLSFLSLMKGEKNGFSFAASLTLATARVFLFLLTIIASTAVSGEIQTGLLKTMLVRRLRRDEVVVGKALAFLVLSSAALLLIIILSLTAGAILYGLGDIADKGFVIRSASSLVLNTGLAVLLTILSLSALINFSLFFSVLFNNNLVSLVVSLGFHVLASLFMEFEGARTFLLTAQLLFPLERLHKIAQGFPSPSGTEVLTSAFVCAFYAAVSLAAALVIFRRKDLP